MSHPLLTSTGFDRAAIMVRAWSRAKAAVASNAKSRATYPAMRLPVLTLRGCFAAELRFVWDEARGARSMVVWRAEQEAAQAALATLDARTREIAELRFFRAAADGIDNTREHFATVDRIDARLQQLGA